MGCIRVDVEFGFDARLLVFEVEPRHALGDVRAVSVPAGNKEGRHALFCGEQGGGARVNEPLEVGAAAHVFDGVFVVWISRVGLHCRKGREFTAGGESKDAYFVGVDAPFLGLGSDGAKRPARVRHRVILNGVGGVFFAGQSVFQNEGRDTVFLKPFGESVSLVAEAEFGMPAPRCDKDGQPGVVVRFGKKSGDRGVVDV